MRALIWEVFCRVWAKRNGRNITYEMITDPAMYEEEALGGESSAGLMDSFVI